VWVKTGTERRQGGKMCVSWGGRNVEPVLFTTSHTAVLTLVLQHIRFFSPVDPNHSLKHISQHHQSAFTDAEKPTVTLIAHWKLLLHSFSFFFNGTEKARDLSRTSVCISRFYSTLNLSYLCIAPPPFPRTWNCIFNTVLAVHIVWYFALQRGIDTTFIRAWVYNAMAKKNIKFSRKADSLQACNLSSYIRINFIYCRKHYVTVTNSSQLMLFRGTVQSLWIPRFLKSINVPCFQNFCVTYIHSEKDG
jgi:hypothetical protein